MRTGCFAAVLLVGLATVASAQTPPTVYVSGGLAFAALYPGDKRQNSIPDVRSWTTGTDVGFGVQTGPRAGVEAMISFRRGQPALPNPWNYTYNADAFIRTTSRDLPILGLVRITPNCSRLFCIQPLVGAGVTWHSARSIVVEECSPILVRSELQTCTPVEPGRRKSDEWTDGSFEFTIAAGVDAPAQISKHLSLAPTFRLLIIRRGEDLTRYRHRGPDGTSSVVPSFGVTLIWKSR